MLLSLVFSIAMAQSDSDSRIQYELGNASIDVPFELNSNKIYLPVRIGEAGPYWFVLDSGSPVTSIDLGLARELHLELTDIPSLGGAGSGQVSAANTQISSVKLPGLSFHPAHPVALELDSVMNSVEGRHVMGLIGGDFFAKTVVEIDYVRRRVSFRNPAEFKKSGAGIPIDIQGWMYAKGNVRFHSGEPLKGSFLVDTGARVALTLNSPIVNQRHLMPRGAPMVAVGSGIGGMLVHGVGRISSLTLGSVTVKNIVATYSQDKGGVFASGQFEGLIGAGLLRRYRVTVDYPRKRLYLEPGGLSHENENDGSGLFLGAEGPNLRSFKVLHVDRSSVAAAAEIAVGDRLLKLNGRDVGDFSLEEIRAKLRQNGATVNLILQRAGKPRSVSLQLKPLV